MPSAQGKGQPSLRVPPELDDFVLPNLSNTNNPHPRHFRHFIWDADALDSYLTPSADLTETLPPFDGYAVSSNKGAARTYAQAPRCDPIVSDPLYGPYDGTGRCSMPISINDRVSPVPPESPGLAQCIGVTCCN